MKKISIFLILVMAFAGCSDIAIEPDMNETPDDTTVLEEPVTLAMLGCKEQQEANQELADFDVIYVGHECDLSDGTTLYGFASNNEEASQVVAHYNGETLLNSAAVDPCRSMGDVGFPRITDFDNGLVTITCAGGDAGHFTSQTHELDLETFEISLIDDVSGAYHNDENISFKYLDPYTLNFDTDDLVVLEAEDGGYIDFYTGSAERAIGFSGEEGDSPIDSNFIDLTVKKGTVKNSNDLNEYLFEDGGYSVADAIGLIFFGVENEEEKFVSVQIEYTNAEQKTYFLEVVESLEVL
jgi:hypothetical protein